MPTTPELKITHIEQSQASKEVTANAAFDDLDQAVAAYAPIAIGGTGAYVLTTDESQNRMIELTGVLTGNRTFEVPTDDRVYTIFNNTTGAFTVEVKTTAGTGVIIDQGKHLRVYCDSTDVLPFSETLPHIVLIVSSSGGSATFDFDKSSVIRSTLTENITTLTLSNGKDGQRILLELRQDGTHRSSRHRPPRKSRPTPPLMTWTRRSRPMRPLRSAGRGPMS